MVLGGQIMKILVTGGTGYIGSHTIVELLERNYEVVCVDNLCNSKKSVIERIENVCNDLNLPIEKFKPKDSKGKEHCLGLFEEDGNYLEFITQGAKKYAYIDSIDKEIHITVSGVPINSNRSGESSSAISVKITLHSNPIATAE